KLLLYFFSVDATEWNGTKAIKWILLRMALSIIVLGLGFYTAKTSAALAVDFGKSPTSFTQRAMFNQSIALPLSKICLPLLSVELDAYFANLKNISPAGNETHYQELLIAYFSNETITKETLLGEESHWPNFLLFVVHYYLNFIMEF